jgi:hypothetical protein
MKNRDGANAMQAPKVAHDSEMASKLADATSMSQPASRRIISTVSMKQ